MLKSEAERRAAQQKWDEENYIRKMEIVSISNLDICQQSFCHAIQVCVIIILMMMMMMMMMMTTTTIKIIIILIIIT